MKQLDPDRLEPADIVLTTGNALSSKAIRLSTKSEISHAMIYVEPYSVIDATGDGVQARNIQRELFDDGATIVGLRLVRGVTTKEQATICQYVRSVVGSEYSILEAARAPFQRGTRSRRQFCSRLAAQAYAAAGIMLVENPDFCTPEALRRSPLLRELGDVTIALSADEIERIESSLNLPEMTAKATNFILLGARQLDGSIQALNDVHEHLFRCPRNDGLIHELYRRSGYLDLWRLEVERNPWQYDLRLMNQLADPPEVIGRYCRSTIQEDALGASRFVTNHALSAKYAAMTGLKTFAVLRELYEALALQHCQRRWVAIRWVQASNQADEVPVTPGREPAPNSPEWLTVLAEWNPASAEMSKLILARVGRLDVCAVCGDEGAQDYRMLDPESSPCPVKVFRLCEDCAHIRNQMGERWIRRGVQP